MQVLTLEDAVKIVDAKAAGAPSDGRLLGDHPDGGPIAARAGRFGAYVSWNKVNATLPKSMTLETVSLEEAIRLLEDRISSGGGKPAKRPAAKKPAAKKPAAKKADDEKPAAKKAAATKKPAAKKNIEDSDEAPFEGGAPAKKTAAKKK
jgi:DNA topoisomerase-1